VNRRRPPRPPRAAAAHCRPFKGPPVKAPPAVARRQIPTLEIAVAVAAAACGNSLPRPEPAGACRRIKRAPLRIIRLVRRLAQLLLEVSVEEITAMFENLFGIHETALLLHGERLGVLATNLANADTPGYKARDIDFSAVLSQTQGETQLPLQVTHAAHITFDDSELPPGELKYRNPYQASLDGNTVEMPVEQAAFSENNVRYQASLNFINGRISEMQLAIAGQ
jgi:flagellar basal-body rod protein FlgB